LLQVLNDFRIFLTPMTQQSFETLYFSQAKVI